MTTARSAQIDYSATTYYHLMSRCVRRAYLCGADLDTGKDYTHRKQWLISRIKELASIFSVHICAYAVMSNHYHLVLHVDLKMAQNWTSEEVLDRWSRLFGKAALNRIAILSPDLADKKIEEFRSRLSNLSWYMRCLNEPIARRANKEDELDGRFWQGRFKCQALLDEGALLSAMAYVDLNPIRAKTADTPENSEFTSIYERIQAIQNQDINLLEPPQPADLMPFSDKAQSSESQELVVIDFKVEDYLQLIDETGRILREDKPGRILECHAPILARLNLTCSGWMNIVKNLETEFSYVLGHYQKFNQFANAHRIRSPRGKKLVKRCYLAA